MATRDGRRQEFLTCRDKRRYRTYGDARASAGNAVRSGRVRALRVYECELCGGWHLTKKRIDTCDSVVPD